MNKFTIFRLLPALLILTPGCGQNKQTVDKRRPANVDIATGEPTTDRASGNQDPSGAAPTVFAPLELTQAGNANQLNPVFLSNLRLISKVSENRVVLFGSDGKSWIYNPGDNVPPEVLDPVVVPPPNSALYTLPEGEFWIVSPAELGKRKASSENNDAGLITVERFATDRFEGNKAEIKVLYAAKSEIILSLGTHLVVLSTRAGQASFSQFAMNKLPVTFEGPIVAAGQAQGGAYWLASRDRLALLEPKGTSFSWKAIQLPMAGRENYTHLGLWLDQGSQGVLGDAAMLFDNAIWSVSGAPIAAAPPP